MYFLLILPFSTALETCSKYSCPPDTVEFGINQCVVSDSSSIYLSPCTDIVNSECDLTTYECKVPSAVPISKYPGEKCSTFTDCIYSKDCLENICVGTNFNESCSHSFECNPGLYCNSEHVCVDQSNKQCESDYNCDNKHSCTNNKCVEYFSLDENKVCEECNLGLNLACESSMCNDLGLESYCYGFFKHANDSAIECENNLDCVSEANDNLETVQSECKCGKNPSGKSFCSLLPGDEVYKNYLKIWKSWTRSDSIKKCNTMRRFASDCMKDWWEEKNFIYYLYYQMTLLNYAELQEIDYCTESIYFQEYSVISDKFENIEDFEFDNAIWVVSFITISLII